VATVTQQSAAWVNPADNSLVFRVVGFLEYGAALNNLDALVASASPQELQAIDAILQDRPEFTVFVNIASRVQRLPSTLVPTSAAEPRRGLAWVLALARAELGGMVATFGQHPSPFAAVRPTTLELDAYRAILLDGSQTHYWALVNDPQLAKVAKSVPDTQMLAYIRRLNAVRHFLRAGANGYSKELKPPQVAEILAEDQRLGSLRQDFVATVADYLAAMTYSQSSTQTTSDGKVMARACSAQLGGEAAELRLGTAKVQTFGQ
jgi:hypothetical protein